MSASSRVSFVLSSLLLANSAVAGDPTAGTETSADCRSLTVGQRVDQACLADPKATSASSNPPYLMLDGYRYRLSGDTQIDTDRFVQPDLAQSVHDCRRANGSALSDDVSLGVVMMGDTAVGLTGDVQLSIASGAARLWTTSVDGDVVCAEHSGPVDGLFGAGFESGSDWPS